MVRFGKKKVQEQKEVEVKKQTKYVEVTVNLELINNKLNHIIALLGEDE